MTAADARAPDWLGRHERVGRAIAEARYAYEHQPFFRDHLDAAGIDPGALRDIDDFRSIPPTVKADYRRNFPRRVLAKATRLDHPLVIHSRSSGTGGDRLITVAFSYDLAARMASALDANPPFKALLHDTMGDAVCRFAPPNCSEVECATALAPPEERIVGRRTLVLPVAHDLLASPQHIVEQTMEEIEAHQPQWLDADATHLAFLVRQYRAIGRPLPDVRAILLSYTLGTQVARRQITEAFPGVVAAEVLMMTELGFVAVECPAGRLHLNTRSFFTELLRGGEPVEPGAPGELVATSLGDRLLPHVRYETGDVYRLVGSCECGNGDLPAVRFEGRWRHMMVRDGEVKLTPKGLDDLVGAPGWMVAYRLYQRDAEHFRFQYVPADDATARARSGPDDLRARLVDALGGGGSLRLDFEAVPHIATDRTGKFVSCVSSTPEEGARARGG